MSLNDLSDRVHALGSAWEQFKNVNDRRLSEIERKGSADPLHMEQLSKISGAMDNYKSRLDVLETAQARPGLELATKGRMQGTGHVSEYKKAFCNYLRKGMDAGLEELHTKALSVGSDPDGGYLVTPTMSQNIIKLIEASSPMRALAGVETISSDSLEILEDVGEAAAGWTTETGAVTDTTTPQIGKRIIAVHELYAQPKATQKLVDDSAIDIENWIGEKVAAIFARKESTAFISGTGTGQPRGILTYTAGTDWGEIEQISSGVDGAVTADSLMNLYYSLKEEYSSRATFMMNRSVVQAIRLIKDSATDQYIWQPGLSAGAPDTLLGVPVAQSNDMPVAAINSLSVALADFASAYLIVDRIGIRTLRDPYTDKPFVKFYTTKRVGGDVVNFDAVKLLKLAV
ncbi:MAG: phage major capsid protein [Alphaproteobacteria bacterium]|nr:phage major capsid protein [Alphaproteobacteria bacterium]